MTAEQFAYWLQGYAELHAAPPTAEQWQSIRDHLATVFHKVTPPISTPGAGGSVPYWNPHGPGSIQPARAICAVGGGDGDTYLVC